MEYVNENPKYNKNKSNSWKKSGVRPKDIPKETFIKICNESVSMTRAAAKMGLHFNTFRKYAKQYNCYKTNQSLKGVKKHIPRQIEKLEDYATRASVRGRVLQDNLLDYECKECGIKEWNKKEIALELDHINCKRDDHRLENLRFLCPNCHSQTKTFRGKNLK
jgi:hypothetical protein